MMTFGHKINSYQNSDENIKEKYLPSIFNKFKENHPDNEHAVIDSLTMESFFEHLLKGDEMPIDVYDAVSWMCVSCLSEESIAKGGVHVSIPDFTCGKWVMCKPMDVIDLDKE